MRYDDFDSSEEEEASKGDLKTNQIQEETKDP